MDKLSHLRSKLWRFLGRDIFEIKEVEETHPRPDSLKQETANHASAQLTTNMSPAIGIEFEKKTSRQEKWSKKNPRGRKTACIKKRKGS